MSDITNAADYLRRIIQAIADGRIEARSVLDMTAEQIDEYHARLVDEEKAEIERGKKMFED